MHAEVSAGRVGPARAVPRRSPWAERVRPLLLRLGVLVVVLAAWQAAGDDSVRLAMPTVTRTLRAFRDLAVGGELWRALLQSNQAMVAGYALALAAGLPLGVAMGTVPAAARAVQPYLTVLLAIPLIAVLPLIQAVFGLGFPSRVVVVFLFAVVYIAVNTRVGVETVSPEAREMARSFGATPRHLLLRVVLPSAFPSIMAGARLGLARAIVGMVVAELFLVSEGVGSLIAFYRERFDPAFVFALACALIGEGVLVVALARRLEARVVRW